MTADNLKKVIDDLRHCIDGSCPGCSRENEQYGCSDRLREAAAVIIEDCFYDILEKEQQREGKRMNRQECLRAAEIATGGHRVTDYGRPENNFAMIAGMWSEYLHTEVSALDVAMMMGLLKIARVKGAKGAPANDCFVDLAGYAACGCEISAENERANEDEHQRTAAGD